MPPKVSQWIEMYKNKEGLFIPTKTITEQEVLKVFEEWGYHITTNDKYLVIFDSEKQFIIDKEQKQYFVSNWNNEHDRYKITLQEHQLLHRLFAIWGWLDE